MISLRPAYNGLTNNISTALQELKGYPWPLGTEDFVNVRVKGAYIQGYSKHFGIEPLTRYNTRVEELEKVGQKWKLRSSTLVKGPREGWEKFEGVEVTNPYILNERLLRAIRNLTQSLLQMATITPARFLIYPVSRSGKLHGRSECSTRNAIEDQMDSKIR